MEEATRLFDRPKPYTAEVQLSNILVPPLHGARSRARRSIEAFGALTLPLLQEIHPPEKVLQEGVPRYKVIDGARRIHDLLALDPDGWVEAKILPLGVDSDTTAAMSVALNFGRAPNPLQEAEHFARLRESGYELSAIGSMLGISVSKIRRRLMLLDDLDQDLLDYLRGGHIAVGVAERAARLSPGLQKKLAEQLKAGEIEKLTGDDISDVQRSVREGMLPSEGMFPDAGFHPIDRFRNVIGSAREEGVSFEQAFAVLAEAYGVDPDAG